MKNGPPGSDAGRAVSFMRVRRGMAWLPGAP